MKIATMPMLSLIGAFLLGGGSVLAQVALDAAPAVPPAVGAADAAAPGVAAPVPRAEAEPELPRIEAAPVQPGGEAGSRVGSPAPRPAVLAWLESQGVSLTALGEEGGLRAYLGEAAGGQMQVFYVTPDG